MKRRFTSKTLIIFLATIVGGLIGLIPTLYTVLNLANLDYRDNVMSNLFATVFGAAIGVPFGLAINDLWQKQQDKKEADEATYVASWQKTEILSHLKDELNHNLSILGDINTPRTDVSLPGLRNDLWRAFSDGGELQWINDAQLLGALATAYYHIQCTMNLENKFLDVEMYPGLRVEQDNPPNKRLIKLIQQTDRNTFVSISKAIELTNTSLEYLRLERMTNS